MDRPDCLSLSYSAARLCYEDSKQMRSLHLLPHHPRGKKTKKQTTSSTQMVTWIFLALIPKGSSPNPVVSYAPMTNVAALCSGKGPRQQVPRVLRGAHSTKVGEQGPRPMPWKARESCSISTENAWPTCDANASFQFPLLPTGNLHCRALLCFLSDSGQAKALLPDLPTQQMGKHPSGGWLGFNAPRSSQFLPPYCLPHQRFLKIRVWKTTENYKKQYTTKNHLKSCCCYSVCSPTQKIPKYFPLFLVSKDSISHTTSFPKSSNSETLQNHRPQLNNHVGSTLIVL